MISPWTYDCDEDDPDPRAPVRDRPATPPQVDSGEDAWLEERERRPPARPVDPAEQTIRPSDPTPRSRPPRPAEFGAWIHPAAARVRPTGPVAPPGQPVPPAPSVRPAAQR
ncbi:serine/threonine protein kinase, partial [Frankia sp. R82]|nr:serine/threonine protein kinase [Frankia sp. R82]